MPRRLDRVVVLLLLTWLLPGLDASAAPSPNDLQRMKLLQRQILLREPAERLEDMERREHLRAWRRKHSRSAGYRLRRPAAAVNDGEPVARAAPSVRLSTSALVAAPANDSVNASKNEPSGSCQSEVSLAANGNLVVAAWNDGIGIYDGTDTQGYGYSTDGGLTWTDGGVPAGAADFVWSSDPVVVVNETTGAFYYCGLYERPTAAKNGIAVIKGSFSGSTFSWGAPVPAVEVDRSTGLLDKEWMAADPLTGNLYLSYSHFDVVSGTIVSDEIRFLRSRDDNLTWTDLQTVSAPTDAGTVQGSRPAVGPDGEIYVVWHAIGQSSGPDANSAYGRDFLRVRKSVDQGASFAPQVTADSIFSNWGTGAPGFNRGIGVTFPGIAVDRSTGPNRGRVYITWGESVNFYDDAFPDPSTEPIVRETENNNLPRDADSFQIGDILQGTISYPFDPKMKASGDFDYWKWDAVQGQTYIFYLDSLDTKLDASFRAFCTNGWSNLAFSQNGSGGRELIVFTAPSPGTYFLRVASYEGFGTGKYRILTTANGPQADRARDQRDAFVKSSPNGFTWGPTVRVNDSPGYLDDFLPEVQVDGYGRVFAACYDWRDTPALCSGGSNVYLYRSTDGGADWSGGSRISDTATDWTSTYSALIPNQGDYIGLFARDSTVYVAWGDGRKGDPDIYFASTTLNCPSAPVVLESAVADTDGVVVTWSAPAGMTATLERRQGASPYLSLGQVVANEANRIVYPDTVVTPGETYSYRLGVGGFCEEFVGDASVRVPVPGGTFAIHNLRPNPTRNLVRVSFSLESAAPATLALYDITGRRIVKMDVGALGPGPHVVDLSRGLKLQAGMYFVSLSQKDKITNKRVSVLR